jgi:hypothetical protein
MHSRLPAAAFGVLLALTASPARAEPCPGTYVTHDDGVTGQIEFGADGRFHYKLAFGGLNETAQGHWRWAGDRLLLAGDPVTPPEFVMVSDDALTVDRLQVDLDLPDGVPLQYFNVVLQQPDGAIRGLQFAADGLDVALDPAHPPAAMRIDLPVVNFSSRSFPLTPGGHSLKLRFLPHDLGKAVLKDAALTEHGTTLTFERRDRQITFAREGRCGGP